MNHSTTIAPSEAHLEDWIAHSMLSFGYTRDDGVWNFIASSYVGRQVPLPSGIADLIVIDDRYNSLCVVELKKGEIDQRALAQVLRYMYDLKGLMDLALLLSTKAHDRYSQEERKELSRRKLVSGILVGHRIVDRNILIACKAAGIRVFQYQLIGDEYTFNPVELHGSLEDFYPLFCEEPDLNDALFSVMDIHTHYMRQSS